MATAPYLFTQDPTAYRTPLDLRGKSMTELMEMDRVHGTWLDDLTPEQMKEGAHPAILADRRQLREEMERRRVYYSTTYHPENYD
jgi:hypothetical protein